MVGSLFWCVLGPSPRPRHRSRTRCLGQPSWAWRPALTGLRAFRPAPCPEAFPQRRDLPESASAGRGNGLNGARLLDAQLRPDRLQQSLQPFRHRR